MAESSEARDINRRHRSTRVEVEAFEQAMLALVEENRPCTVRQAYYIVVSRGLLEKDTGGKRNSYTKVTRTLGDLRERGELPFSWISDSTRWRRQAQVWTDAESALDSMVHFYRRDLWQRQARHLEVWVESDSIAGLLAPVTRRLGIGIMPCRGQSSKTFCHVAAQEYLAVDKPVTVLYVGDFDPSGFQIDRSLEERLRRYAPGVDLDFQRIGVTPAQVRDLGLVGHKANRADNNFPSFEARCVAEGLPVEAVETEALPPDYLREVVEQEVLEYVDPVAWDLEQAVEASEREGLRLLVGGGLGGAR